MARRKARPAGTLNSDRRRHLVSTVAEILRQGSPTFFAYEGACRHGLRIRLICEGWGWHMADNAALDVVGASLRMIGAKRPTWYQGQPACTEEGFAPIRRTRCVNCGRPLDPDLVPNNGWETRFCSQQCRTVMRRKSGSMDVADYNAALKAVGEAKRLSRGRPCQRCQKPFIPHHAGLGGLYCSMACYNATRYVPTRPCEWCGALLDTRKSKLRFCSPRCSAMAREAGKRSIVCEVAE